MPWGFAARGRFICGRAPCTLPIEAYDVLVQRTTPAKASRVEHSTLQYLTTFRGTECHSFQRLHQLDEQRSNQPEGVESGPGDVRPWLRDWLILSTLPVHIRSKCYAGDDYAVLCAVAQSWAPGTGSLSYSQPFARLSDMFVTEFVGPGSRPQTHVASRPDTEPIFSSCINHPARFLLHPVY